MIPRSCSSIPTRMFELGPADFLYSIYRPDLAALGAIDGRPASGLPQDNDDALSRRDAGLEFLDVTAKLSAVRIESKNDEGGKRREDDPHLREFLTDGVLLPDQSILVRIVVRRHSRDTAIGYSLRMLSGQGNP